MHYIYATTNVAKINHMRKILKNSNITFEALPQLPFIPIENGNSPLENAVIKAKAYYEVLHKPLFSIDSVLCIDDKPIINVRLVDGKELSDSETTNHYANLAKANGGKLKAYYKNAICIITEQGITTYDGHEIASAPFYIIDKPHHIKNPGFPLDCLSVDIKTNKYFYDLDIIYDSNYNYLDVFLGKLKNEN